ncbi:hypothetical protein V491_07435 [Pseudogymnoascus sp. VKM F-3775]|nr:hypothetical protein V491_07435 [Pseudogymnoascus sp. VKM F-3775]
MKTHSVRDLYPSSRASPDFQTSNSIKALLAGFSREHESGAINEDRMRGEDANQRHRRNQPRKQMEDLKTERIDANRLALVMAYAMAMDD